MSELCPPPRRVTAHDGVGVGIMPTYPGHAGRGRQTPDLQGDTTGRSHVLTGTYPLSFPEVAAILTSELGHRVRYLHVPAPLMLAGLRAGGVPSWQARGLVHQFVDVVRRGATPVDLAEAPYNLDGSAQAGTGLFVVSGLRHTYPDLEARLDPYLTPLGRTTLDSMADDCSTSNQITNIGRQYDTLFTEPFAVVWSKPEIREVLDRARLGTTPTDVPRLLYHSVNDEAVPVTGLDQYARAECDGGARLTVRREELGLHLTTAVSGLALSMDWLDARSREPAPSQPYCDISTVPSFVGADPAATVRTVAETVRSLLGLPRN